MRQAAKAIKDLQGGIRLSHVWVNQAYHEVTSKYKRTILGPFWIAGQVVSFSLALALVFGVMQGADIKSLIPYIMGGVLTWGMVGYVFSDGTELFSIYQSIIRNHAYPFTYYIFESTARVMIQYLHNLVIYVVFMLILGVFKIPHWTFVPGLLVVYLNINIWGLMAGMAAARFKDVRFLLPFIGQIVFYITPVFWRPGPIATTHKVGAFFIHYNPFYALTEIAREPLLGQSATGLQWALALCITAIGAILLAFVFTTFRRRIAFWI